MGKQKVLVRRSVDYGSDRRASSYLIEGANGWRFAKCSIEEAAFISVDKAKKILKSLKRTDPLADAARYELI